MNTKAKEKKKLTPEELFNEWWANEIDYGAHKFTEKERVAAYHGYMVGYNKACEGNTVLNTESKCNKHFVIHCQNCNGTNVEKSYVHQNKIYCHDCEKSF
jgi:hypothetical protein